MVSFRPKSDPRCLSTKSSILFIIIGILSNKQVTTGAMINQNMEFLGIGHIGGGWPWSFLFSKISQESEKNLRNRSHTILRSQVDQPSFLFTPLLNIFMSRYCGSGSAMLTHLWGTQEDTEFALDETASLKRDLNDLYKIMLQEVNQLPFSVYFPSLHFSVALCLFSSPHHSPSTTVRTSKRVMMRRRRSPPLSTHH